MSVIFLVIKYYFDWDDKETTPLKAFANFTEADEFAADLNSKAPDEYTCYIVQSLDFKP